MQYSCDTMLNAILGISMSLSLKKPFKYAWDHSAKHRAVLGCVCVLLVLLYVLPAHALPSTRILIKAKEFSTVYYFAEDGKRYVFPNAGTFASWYPDGSRIEITILSPSELASIPLAGNVTYRPGMRMVKITTDPKVYVVSRYGVLHWITTESIATQLYGLAWNKQISDVPDVFFANYTVGAPITSKEMYSPSTESSSVPTVQENILKAPIVTSSPPLSFTGGPSSGPSSPATTPTPPPTTAASPATTPSSSPTTASSPATTISTSTTTAPAIAGFGMSSSNPLSCTDAKTLEELVVCIVSHFGPFVPPSATERSDFRTLARALFNGNCETIPLPSTLSGIFSIRSFTDRDTSKTYCVLMEVKDADGDTKADRGWGSIFVNNASKRELNIAIAHPMDDWKTENQGIGVFKATDSRTFFLAGARRYIGTPSACQPDNAHSSSDAAHNTATMFFAATQELNDWYGSRLWHQLQFHGMGTGACPGVSAYMTYGKNTTPASGDILLTLKAKILAHHPAWSVTVPGDTPSCTLSATTNVQGRHLNGISAGDVCATPASTYSQKFISIEQAPGFRLAKDWNAAIQETWPIGGTGGFGTTPSSSTSASSTPPSSSVSSTSGSGGGGTSQLTFFTSYGYNDNDDGFGHYGTAAIAYPSSRHPIATEGLGTYADPVTFATDPREIPPTTIIYVPYLQKYFVMDDGCVECTTDWNAGKKWRTDLFMGGNTALQPEPALANCQASITRKDIMYINAGPGYPVDTTPLFSGGVCTARFH